jgi:hypothetical protein
MQAMRQEPRRVGPRQRRGGMSLWRSAWRTPWSRVSTSLPSGCAVAVLAATLGGMTLSEPCIGVFVLTTSRGCIKGGFCKRAGYGGGADLRAV